MLPYTQLAVIKKVLGLFYLIVCLSFITFFATAQIKDTITFGNTTSESSHALIQSNTQIISGNLGQPARQALAPATPSIYGGYVTFTMNVDSVNRNYVSLKMWGGDYGTTASFGRLYLYVVQNGVTYQVGYRHEGDYTPMGILIDKPALPGRFVYSTTLLPLSMTRGKTSITLQIISTGRLYGLGSGGPPNGNYQFYMTQPSRAYYKAYTHISPFLDVSSETQGTAPTATTNPSPTISVMNVGGSYYNAVNSTINNMLGLAANVTNFGTENVEYLAKSYGIKNMAGYQNLNVVNKVTAVIDAFAIEYYNNNNAVFGGGNEGWGGRYGYLGYAIYLLRNQLASSLDVQVNYGSSIGYKTRRQAWGDMLVGSRDSGRAYRDGRLITNQCLLANANIYKANKALLALGDSRALAEPIAQRYLMESIGLSPWLGSDILSSGTSSLSAASNYYEVTQKGLSREFGYVGISYGEMQQHAALFYKLTGNEKFRQQAIKMLKARAPFRRPAVQVNGSSYYNGMEGIGLLAWRGRSEVDGDFGNEVAYGDRSGNFGLLQVAATTMDSTCIAYAKQALNDNWFFSQLTSTYAATVPGLDAFDEYNTITGAYDNGTRLPMTNGQPDFVWSDEESGIMALKKNNERLWIEPYWQSKSQSAVNGIGRFHYSVADHDQYGDFETNPFFTYSGQYVVRPNEVDGMGGTTYQPPDNPTNAYFNEKLPIAANGLMVLPAGMNASSSLDGFMGKCDAYSFRFGKFLIGMNCSRLKNFTLNVPQGFTSATELVSAQTVNSNVTVNPSSTAVVYLNSNIDSFPVPTSPLLVYISATTASSKTLTWRHSSGKSSYNLKRSTIAGGSYTTIASGITDSSYTDNSVAAGTTYYYVVSAVNANGESYNSHEVCTAGFITPAPTCANAGTDTAYLGVPYTFTVAAYNSPTSFTASGLPSGVTINTQNGIISGIPSTIGQFTVNVSVTGLGGTTSSNYTIIVSNPNKPNITSPDTVTAYMNVPFSYQIVATNSPQVYHADSLPVGFTIDSVIGLIKGTFGNTNAIAFLVRATNSNGTDTQRVVVNVSMPPIPVITNESSQTNVVGKSFYLAINASNSPTSYSASNLPSGLAINTTTGLITGIPNVAGTFSVVLSAQNASGTGNQTVSLIILSGVPAPWQDSSFSNGGGYASYSSSNTLFTVAGSGSDIGGYQDAFHFLYQPVLSVSTTSLMVKLESRQLAQVSGSGVSAADKVGIMIRESLDSNSSFCFVFVDPINNVYCSYRNSKGANTSYLGPLVLNVPVWLRVDRNNNQFTAFASLNKSSWDTIGSVSFAMKSSMYVGMAVTSRNNNLDISTFDSITLSASTPTNTNWTGSQNTSWSNASNWTNGVPDSSKIATIPTGLASYPAIASGATAAAFQLNVASGATISNAGSINIYSNLVDSGTISGVGAVYTVASSVFKGNGSISNLVDSIGTLTMANDFSIGNLRVASNSQLDNGGYVLTVTGNVTITTSAVHIGSGKIKMTGAGSIYASTSTSYQSNLEIDCGNGNTIYANSSSTSVGTNSYYSGNITVTTGTFTLNGPTYIGNFNASTTHNISIASGAVLNTFNDNVTNVFAQGNTINVINNGLFGQSGTSQYKSAFFWCQTVKTLNFSGSGTYKIAGFTTDNNAQSVAITISSNMTLYGSNSNYPSIGLQYGNNQYLSPANSDSRSLTINTGYTVTVKGGWFGNNTVNSALTCPKTYTINGTLDVSGSSGIGLIATSNTTANRTGVYDSITINVGSSGILKCPSTVYTGRNQPATQGFLVNVANGGLITYGGTSYSATRNNAASGTSSLITVNNSNVQFTSSSAISLQNDSTLVTNNLTFGGAATFSGVGNTTVNGTLTLGGKLTLGTGNLTIGSNTISGVSSANYIITPSTGSLIASTTSGVPYLFPIGASSSSFTPITINAVTGSATTVSVSSSQPSGTGITNGVINKVWSVVPATATAATISLGYAGTSIGTGDASITPVGSPIASMNLITSSNGSSWTSAAASASTPQTGTFSNDSITFSASSGWSSLLALTNTTQAIYSYQSVANTDWATTSTWQGNSVPATNGPAIINSNVSINTAGTTTINTLTVNAGFTLTIASGATLNITGNAIINGTIAGAGTVLMNGASTTLSGSGTISNLQIATNTITLGSNFSVTNLSFASSGTLADAGYTTTLAGNLSGAGTESGTGKIKMIGAGTSISSTSSGSLNLTNVEIATGAAANVVTIASNGNAVALKNNLTITSGTFTIATSGSFNGMYYGSGGTVSNPATLTIANGAVLSTPSHGTQVLQCQGIVVINNSGILGESTYNGANTGLSIQTRGGTSVTINNPNGTGVCNLSSIGTSFIGTVSTSITIGQSMTLSSSGLALTLESTPTAATRSLTINQGTTVTIKSGYFHINQGNTDTTAALSTDTYNINGTLDVSSGKIGLVTTSNATVGASGTTNALTVNIGSTGNLICGSYVHVNKIQSGQTIAVNVASGGTITYTGASYTTTQGTSVNNSLLTTTNSNLTISGATTLALASNLAVANSFTTNAATILTGSGALTVSGTSSINGLLTLGNSNVIINSLSLSASPGINLNGYNLTINGAVSGTGTITGSSTSNINMLGTGTLYFDQSTPNTTNTLNNLTINSSGTFALGNTLNVVGTVTPTAGTLSTGGYLTLVSNAAGTARIDQVLGTIAGNVTVQRYISAKAARRFSFIGSSVTQSIRNSWQQQIYITGAGTGGQVCGATSGDGGTTDKYNSNGFDRTGSNSPSMYTYSATPINGSRYVSISNTNSTSLTPGIGYKVNVRGDRNSNNTSCNNQLNTSSPAAPEAVTLSATGTVTTGNVVASLNNPATHTFTLLANPYPSQISFSAFKASNTAINNKMWTYSPFSSTGNYTTYSAGVIANGATGYDNTSGDLIASGQAFFVEANTAGSVTFSETNKTSGSIPNTQYFGATNQKLIRLGLYALDNVRLDEIVIRYNADGSKNYLTNWDATSFGGGSQRLASLKEGKFLSIATRSINDGNDTVQLLVKSSAVGCYLLKASNMEGFDSSNTSIVLKDNLLNTTQSLLNNPDNQFNITADTASNGSNRFVLIVNKIQALPITFTNVEGKILNGNAVIDWAHANTAGIKNYIVEKSIDGSNYSPIATVQSSGKSVYQSIDSSVASGKSYYRINAVSTIGNSYSKAIILVSGNTNGAVRVFPTVITNNKLSVQFSNMPISNYALVLYNSLGQSILSKNINNRGGVDLEFININDAKLAAGIYEARLLKENKMVTVQKVVVTIK